MARWPVDLTEVPTAQWFVIGFSLTFGHSHGGLIGLVVAMCLCHCPPPRRKSGCSYRGCMRCASSLDFAFLNGVGMDCLPHLATHIPGALFVSFQMMFALMVPVLVTGAWAEKFPMGAFLCFVVSVMWSLL